MYKPELTEEYKELLRGVIDGTVEPVVDEIGDYKYSLHGLNFYVARFERSAKNIAERILNSNDISLQYSIDDINPHFAWCMVYVGNRVIGSIMFYGGKVQIAKNRVYKSSSRVALERLRNRLDKAII